MKLLLAGAVKSDSKFFERDVEQAGHYAVAKIREAVIAATGR